MTDDNINPGKFLGSDHISLGFEPINWAAKLSQSLADEIEQQWQIYLQALAKLGTVEWLQQRMPELMSEPGFLANSEQFSAQTIDQIQVGNFRLNLIVTQDSADAEVCVPRTLLQRSREDRQFYVLVEVLEDLTVPEESEEQVSISVLGYLMPEQFSQRAPIILDQDLVLLSTDWFELNPEQLLLYLRCWESGPSLVIGHQSLVIGDQVSVDQVQSNPVVNVGSWLRTQVDQIVEELSWILLPPLAYGNDFRDGRSPMELFGDVVAELRHQAQLVIPLMARTAYRDFTWSEINLRLFVTTWEMETNPAEWSLLLLLTAQPSSHLPQGTQLQVRDAAAILEDPVLSDPIQEYLYARVIGDYNEQFFVTINFPNGTAVTLPPFTFVR